jgi:hypothetical protein
MLATGTGASFFPLAGTQAFARPLTYSIGELSHFEAFLAHALPSDVKYFVTAVSPVARDLTIEEERALSAALFAGSRLISRGRLVRG